jgi:hypothetical protein
MITIINRGKGAPTEQTGKGEWTGPPGKGALPAFPVSGKGVALADVDAAGATAHATEPVTPVRQEARVAVTSAIAVEKETPPKALQPGVDTAARASVLATLAQVQQAYAQRRPQSDEDENDAEPSSMKKPAAAATKNRKRTPSTDGKLAKPAGSIATSKHVQKCTKSKRPYVQHVRKTPSICEHASREAFCCRGPDGGKMFTYKNKNRKKTQEDAVSWVKAECKRLRVPVPPSKFVI